MAIGLGLIGTAGGAPVFHAPGVGTAQASEFYSRRRVNGVWVTGRFAKSDVDGELRRLGVGSRPAPRLHRSATSRDASRTRRAGWARSRGQARGEPSLSATPGAADALIAAALAAAPLGALAPVAIEPDAPAARPATTTEADTRREHLRQALEAKAQELASRLASDRTAPAAQPAPDEAATELRPISSTYDYATQVRTTVYQNGVVLKETLANPAEPALVTRRFVGMASPRPAGETATAAR